MGLLEIRKKKEKCFLVEFSNYLGTFAAVRLAHACKERIEFRRGVQSDHGSIGEKSERFVCVCLRVC